MAKTVSCVRRPDATDDTDAIYRNLFDSFNPDKDARISPLEMLARLQRSGLLPDDPRIAEALAGMAGAAGSRQLSFPQFKVLAQHNSSLIRRAVEGNLAVPDFATLTADITRMYDELLPVRSGTVAGYIPQLKRVDPDQLAIAVCTVDGQRFAVGDATTAFCLQSVSKTVSYCLALDEHGTGAVHAHVGREPSGQSFNELALNRNGRPHDPMIERTRYAVRGTGALQRAAPGSTRPSSRRTPLARAVWSARPTRSALRPGWWQPECRQPPGEGAGPRWPAGGELPRHLRRHRDELAAPGIAHRARRTTWRPVVR